MVPVTIYFIMQGSKMRICFALLTMVFGIDDFKVTDYWAVFLTKLLVVGISQNPAGWNGLQRCVSVSFDRAATIFQLSL